MRYLQLFESFNRLQVSLFSEMPRNYQIGVVIRAYEVNEDVEWSTTLGNIDWINDTEVVNQIISDYSNHYPNKRFAYGLVPTNILIDKVCASEDSAIHDYDGGWYEYHQAYSSTNNAKHTSFEIPILVDDSDSEFIEDGWHRFHWYIKSGLKEIPIVSYDPDIKLF